MSNGTRKKKVDFKKLLVTEEDSNIHFRKKSTKSANIPQLSSNKKEKSQKNGQKQKENKEKIAEKNINKKIKTKNLKGKEQITINDFANTLKEYKDELIFLNKKRNSEINFDKIANLQKNNGNKLIGANNSENTNKKNDNNINHNSLEKNINENSGSKIQNNQKMENNSNQSSALLIDFYKLYLHLFESNRLDNSKPYKFVDYLITGDNFLFNIKKDKTKIEEIKRGISIKSKNNNFLINDQLLNKFTYEYLKCDFSHSFMKKFIEKINVFLMNNSQFQKKKTIGGDKVNLNLNAEKKDKFTYSNFLADKLKENSNKSILSFTNDTEYFKSLIYVCNKYSKYIGKKEMPEKILLESLEKNKKILEKFKIEGDEKTLALKEEKDYLKDLLKNRSIRNYINKKFNIFREENMKNNKIFSILNMNIFYKIFEIFLKNKSDDDIDKLYKLFQEEIFSSFNIKIEKNDLKNFIIEFRFLLEIEIAKKKFNNDNAKNFNDISILKKIYENVNRYLLLNKEKTEEENSSNKKGKNRNKSKIKNKKDLSFLESENESINSDLRTNDLINNDMIIEQDEKSIIQNKILNQDNNSENNLSGNQNPKSKIVPFKIPYPRNNSNPNLIINNSTTKNNVQNIKSSLFEINTINHNSNDSPHNFVTTKSIFGNSNKKEESSNKINTFFETEKQDNTKSRTKQRNKRDNNIIKDLNNNNDNNDDNSFNNCLTFKAINSSNLKEKGIINIGKYLLNRLSLGQDIFKLVIEKPKIKKTKEKEINEDKNTDINIPKEEKENIDLKETTKEIYRKDCDTRENSSKNEKTEKIDIAPTPPALDENLVPDKNKNINQVVTTEYIFAKHKSKNKNSKNNHSHTVSDNQRNIDTITFTNSVNSESGNDSIKEITRNDIVHSPNIGIKITQKKNKEIIFNTTNKLLFNTNKLNQVQNKNFKNDFNIQIDRQSVEIKGGNVILNDKRAHSENEDIFKINDYLSIGSI